MIRRLALLLFTWASLLALPAHAQDEHVIVIVIDPGPIRVNIDQLTRAIQTSLARPVVRMTDERAQEAEGRLSIAYSHPFRWVLRYEARGTVGWVSDRINRAGELRSRLSQLTQDLVVRVEGEPNAVATNRQVPVPQSPARHTARRSDWTDDVILALQDEIVDPFANEPRRRSRPISILWSEVVDPFRDSPARAPVTEVWSEVLDPWANEVRRNRRR